MHGGVVLVVVVMDAAWALGAEVALVVVLAVVVTDVAWALGVEVALVVLLLLAVVMDDALALRVQGALCVQGALRVEVA